MTPEEYKTKRQARYERLLAAAERAERESATLIDQSHQMSDGIPFGQPILVGHYSEQRDRNYRARIESKFRRGYEMHQKAEALRSRLAAMEANRAIFSDDPQAVEKLEEKLARLQKRHEMMKAANKLARKGDRDGLAAMGFAESNITKLLEPDWSGHPGFPSYGITNNGANIRSIQKRIAGLERHAQDETSERIVGEVRLVDSVEDNRIQAHFPGKPIEAVRSALKSNGFRWTPSLGCWQAYRSMGIERAAQVISEAVRAGVDTP